MIYLNGGWESLGGRVANESVGAGRGSRGEGWNGGGEKEGRG